METLPATVCQCSFNPINYFTVAIGLWECLCLLSDVPLFHFYHVWWMECFYSAESFWDNLPLDKDLVSQGAVVVLCEQQPGGLGVKNAWFFSQALIETCWCRRKWENWRKMPTSPFSCYRACLFSEKENWNTPTHSTIRVQYPSHIHLFWSGFRSYNRYQPQALLLLADFPCQKAIHRLGSAASCGPAGSNIHLSSSKEMAQQRWLCGPDSPWL